MTDKLVSTVADVLQIPPESVQETTSMENCSQWDSLRHFSLILAVEDAFGVQFSSEDIPSLTQVATLRAKVASLAGRNP